MEEKNNERKKILLVIAIFIVLIAISVGGVYAYFSARATNSGQEITGRTLDINGSTLTIRATRLNLNPSPAPVSDNLLPAKFGVDPTEMTTTQVNKALSKQCVVGGYTGCHVWKITVSSTQDIPSANIKLNLRVEDTEGENNSGGEPPEEAAAVAEPGGLSTPYNGKGGVASPLDYSDAKYNTKLLANNTKDKSNWSYVVYTGTDSSATNIINKGTITTTFPNANTTIDIHNGASLTAGTPAIYYVMVYLNNTNSAQNDGVTTNTTDETARYNGTVILEAMGGEVYVNFYEEEVQPTDVSFFNYTIENNEVTITNYIPKIATYTVSDQSACESYFQGIGRTPENAATLCSGGNISCSRSDGPDCFGKIEQGITSGRLPSSDYDAAGLSNVVITQAPTDVVIPSTIEGYPVTTIRRFSEKGLTSVVIPDSVTTITDEAFLSNSLTSVVIPSSVTSIGEYAFDDNPLTSITVENENATIGECAFGVNPPLDEPFLSRYVCNP